MAASVTCCPDRPSCSAFTLQANKSLDRTHGSFEPARLPDFLPGSLEPVSLDGFVDHLDRLDLAVHVGHYHIDTCDLIGAGMSSIVAGWVHAACRVRRHAVMGGVWRPRYILLLQLRGCLCGSPLTASVAGWAVVPCCHLWQPEGLSAQPCRFRPVAVATWEFVAHHLLQQAKGMSAQHVLFI